MSAINTPRSLQLSFYALISAVVLVACSSSDSTNAVPVANAGADKSARGGATTTLDGTGSFDSDGSIASQSWSQTAGTSVTLSADGSLTPSFTAPNNSETLSFTLTVTDDKGDTSTDTVDVMIKNDVSLLINTSYVDYANLNSSSEAYVLEQGIPAYGYSIVTFTDITETGFIANTTDTTQALVIPELEAGDLDSDLDAATRLVINNYVTNGGVLITFGSTTSEAISFMDGVFGWTLLQGNEKNNYTLQAANAAGTSFEGAQTALIYNTDTTVLAAASLPAEAAIMYADDFSGDAAIVVIPVGGGYVVFLGYDWNEASPLGIQDNGWLDMLDRAIAITD